MEERTRIFSRLKKEGRYGKKRQILLACFSMQSIYVVHVFYSESGPLYACTDCYDCTILVRFVLLVKHRSLRLI